MNNTIVINGQKVPVKALENENSFIVSSMPDSYVVKWEQEQPTEPIIKEVAKGNNVLFIDKNVFEIYFSSSKIDMNRVLIVEANEENKTLASVELLFDFLLKHNFSKTDRLIVVGGGIIQDIAAFVGSTYKRGINWVYFPTTLLSMCDSCIGGKSGLNYKQTKNQMALFSSPFEVVINPHFIETLEEREIKSGLGEVLKLAIIGGKEYLDIYDSCVIEGVVSNKHSYQKLIMNALQVKRSVIEIDEFEKNIRKSLNYGHTIGHVIEVLADYRIPHGQAIVAGMVVVNKISQNLGWMSLEEYNALKTRAAFLYDAAQVKSIDWSMAIPHLMRDKKVQGTSVGLVLIKEAGIIDYYKAEVDEKFRKMIDSIHLQEF